MLPTEKDLLQKLVQLPSVNPKLCEDSEEFSGEAAVTEFLVSYCQDRHWPWLRQQVHPGRDNLLVRVPRGPSADPLSVQLWEAHQDTVGVGGMTIDPFAGVSRDGRIWGRGACDVKGGMASILAAAARVSENSTRQDAALLLAFTVNEECGFTGATALSRLWDPEVSSEELSPCSGPLPLEELRALRPTEAIVAEPTSLNVVVAHQGVVRWKCRTRGRAAHTSRPDEGVNAIYAMSNVVQAVERYHREILATREAHPLCGKPSVSVSTIQGGTGVNTVPDEVVIDIDRRLAPGEFAKSAYQELIDWIATHATMGKARVEHELPWLKSGTLQGNDNRQLGERITAVTRDCGAPSQIQGAPYGTDAPEIAALGIPTVVFGPGSIAQAHTEDEWIDEAQLSLAVEILCRLVTS